MRKPVWRLIRSGPGDAAWNMAMDEAINQSCLEGNSPPTLRLYGWEQSAVTIGRFQKYPISVPTPKIPGTEYVRRITGGRAVRHGGDLTFSLSAGKSQNQIPTQPREGFLVVANLIFTAFRRCGIRPDWGPGPPCRENGHPVKNFDCFSGTESFELCFQGKKILGCAQKRMKNGLLQQGTIRLAVFKKQLDRNGFRDLERGLTLEIKAAFENDLGIGFSSQGLTQSEWNLALRLEKDRYRNPSWNTLGKPLKF